MGYPTAELGSRLRPSPDRLKDVSAGPKPMLTSIDDLRTFLDFGDDISQDTSITDA